MKLNQNSKIFLYIFIILNTFFGFVMAFGIWVNEFKINTYILIPCALFISIGMLFIALALIFAYIVNRVSGKTKNLIIKLCKHSHKLRENVELKVDYSQLFKEFLKSFKTELICFKFNCKLILYTIMFILVLISLFLNFVLINVVFF